MPVFFEDAKKHFAEESEPVTLESFGNTRHAVLLKQDATHFFEFKSIERLLIQSALSFTRPLSPLTRAPFTIHDVEPILTPTAPYSDFLNTVALLAVYGKRELPSTINADLHAYFRASSSSSAESVEEHVQQLLDRIDVAYQMSPEQDPAFEIAIRRAPYPRRQRRAALFALQLARIIRIGCGLQTLPEEVRFRRETNAVEYFEASLADVWPPALPMTAEAAAAYELAQTGYKGCPNHSLRRVLRWTDRFVSARALACRYRPNQRFERDRMARELGRVLADRIRRKKLQANIKEEELCAALLLDARLPRVTTDGTTWWYLLNASSPADQILSALGRIPEAAVQAMQCAPWPLRHLVELTLATIPKPALVYPLEVYELVLRTDARLYPYVLPVAPPPPDQLSMWHEPLFLLAQPTAFHPSVVPEAYDDESMDAAELPQIQRCPSISKAPFYFALIAAPVAHQS